MLQLARQTDWPCVNRLSVQIHDIHASLRPDIYCHSEEPLAYDAFLQLIRERMLYVAKLQDEVVGYVALSVARKDGPGIVPKKVMRIDSICVEQMCRGEGIGKAMIADVRALATAFGCQELVLGVHAENDEAIGFYQKCGFRIRTIHMDMKL